MLKVEINGRPADVEDVHRVAAWNYGHFTSMQVRDRAVRGLNLHLERLKRASIELFGQAIDNERIRELVSHAIDDDHAASVRVTVIPSADGRATDVMVSVSDPVTDNPGPALRVRTALYERELPHLKHVATMGLTYHWLQARKAGFDDVVFVGRDGYVREGSSWNIAFLDGEQVVWPEAAVLPGITLQLLQSALTTIGTPWTTRPVPFDDIRRFAAVAATNSHCPSQPLASIDKVAFSGAGNALTDVLTTAWAEVPWDPI